MIGDEGAQGSTPVLISADSGVITRLTSRSPDAIAYRGWVSGRRIAISFQVRAELLSCNFGATRMARLNELLVDCIDLNHSYATSVWYARVSDARRALQRTHHEGANAGQADMWVLSSTLGHGLVLLAHDRALVQLARAMGVPVFTNLPELRETNPTALP